MKRPNLTRLLSAIRDRRLKAYLYAWCRFKSYFPEYRDTTFKDGLWHDEYGLKIWRLKWSLRGPRVNESLNRLMPNGEPLPPEVYRTPSRRIGK